MFMYKKWMCSETSSGRCWRVFLCESLVDYCLENVRLEGIEWNKVMKLSWPVCVSL